LDFLSDFFCGCSLLAFCFRWQNRLFFSSGFFWSKKNQKKTICKHIKKRKLKNMGDTWSKANSEQEENKEDESEPVDIHFPLKDFLQIEDKTYVYRGSEAYNMIKRIADHADITQELLDEYPEVPMLSEKICEALKFRQTGKAQSESESESERNEDDSSDLEEWIPGENDEESSFGTENTPAPIRKKADEEVKNPIMVMETSFFANGEIPRTPVELKNADFYYDLFVLHKECIVTDGLIIDKIKDMERTRRLEEQLESTSNHLTKQSTFERKEKPDLYKELTVWIDSQGTHFAKYATFEKQYVDCTQTFMAEYIDRSEENKRLYDKLFKATIQPKSEEDQFVVPNVNVGNNNNSIPFFQQRMEQFQTNNPIQSLDSLMHNSSSNNSDNNNNLSPTPHSASFDYNAMDVELWKKKFLETEGWAHQRCESLLRMLVQKQKLYDTILEKTKFPNDDRLSSIAKRRLKDEEDVFF
jgi:hypothetical protein